MTDDELLVLAEGRVQVVWATDGVIQGKVRGDSGVHDVRWTRNQGWHCTCAAYGQRCSHLEAVKRVTMRSPKAPAPT